MSGGGMNLLLLGFGDVDWFGLMLLIPILLVSMMAHELAHGWIAYRMGDPTAKRAGRLSFNPIKHLDPLGTAMFFITYISGGWLFGWAKPIPVSPYYFKNRQRGMAIVGAAGPITNFILAIILILVLNWTHPDPYGRVFDIVFLAFQVNVVLGAVQPHTHPTSRRIASTGRVPSSQRLREVDRGRSLRDLHRLRGDHPVQRRGLAPDHLGDTGAGEPVPRLRHPLVTPPAQ